MFDFNVLKDLSFYFAARPSVGNFGFLVPLAILFGVMLILAIYLKVVYGIYAKKKPYYNELGDRLFNWLATVSILGFLYIFFRYEGIMYLSARILLFALIIIFIYWGYTIWKFYRDEWKMKKAKFHVNKEKKHYMPKRKK